MAKKIKIRFRYPVESEELFWLNAEKKGVVSGIYVVSDRFGAEIDFSAFTPQRLQLELSILVGQRLAWIDKANILVVEKTKENVIKSEISRFFCQFET